MHTRAAIFDMDGTLVDSERVIMSAWLRASTVVGIPLDASQYSNVIGLNDEESNALLISLLGGTSEFREVQSAVRQMLHGGAERTVFPLKEGVRELLGALRDRGVRCAVASSSTAAEIEERLSLAGVLHFFHATAGGDEVHRGKPDPAVYQLAAARLGIAPTSCFAFEDSEHGATAAAAAGARVVLVPDMKAPSRALAASVHVVLESLSHALPLIPSWFPER
ncbi:HAD family phosphatase [Gemmatimonas sp.]|uniref:HAD family hydrolase n=1 Tax=Gemmatimonas sp. TaxID=1962908 RepID=UPI003342A616